MIWSLYHTIMAVQSSAPYWLKSLKTTSGHYVGKVKIETELMQFRIKRAWSGTMTTKRVNFYFALAKIILYWIKSVQINLIMIGLFVIFFTFCDQVKAKDLNCSNKHHLRSIFYHEHDFMDLLLRDFPSTRWTSIYFVACKFSAQ